uniref:CMP/dCMP-type deaminase domain-containing protein n=1 Tax=Nelumbo nucifera TaxID=4432 RepID=A0A822YFX8_NELNU|nr:TPA_asm: hypothetical protein HUJ06_011925 [Nelumbo nucifera]
MTFSNNDHDDGVVKINSKANQCYSNSRVVLDYNKKLKYAALEAANKSHALYSGCPSRVALMDTEGKVYKGSYVELVAYNPSLGQFRQRWWRMWRRWVREDRGRGIGGEERSNGGTGRHDMAVATICIAMM